MARMAAYGFSGIGTGPSIYFELIPFGAAIVHPLRKRVSKKCRRRFFCVPERAGNICPARQNLTSRTAF
jgi:hypothetical protein